MEPDEITRRLLDHFGSEKGWHPSECDGCNCGSCAEGCGCEVPGIFEALGLPVPEPTMTPRFREPVVRVDMSAVKRLDDQPGALFKTLSTVRPTPSA